MEQWQWQGMSLNKKNLTNLTISDIHITVLVIKANSEKPVKKQLSPC